MLGISFLILHIVGWGLIFYGTISALFPNLMITCIVKPFTLKIAPNEKIKSPMTQQNVILKRLLGCVCVLGGITFIHYMNDLPSRGAFNPANLIVPASDDVDSGGADYKSAVKALVANEGISLPEPTIKRPDELLIVSAKYGAGDKWVDVTEQVGKKAHDNTLAIGASNAIAGDPIFGIPKVLKVEYRLDGDLKTAEVREGVVLHIPPVLDADLKVITTPERLIALAKACPAQVGFFGKNLTTGKRVEYRPDQPACLASIVKIFVLLEVMRRADEGTIELSEAISIPRQDGAETCTISGALDKMIGISDNEATNALAAHVGYEQVNRLPAALGIEGLSDKILPEPGILRKVLDKRIAGPRIWSESEAPPQHGAARGIVRYFELLNAGELINERISQNVFDVFDRNPKGFAPRSTPLDYKSGGKGGGITWRRPFRTEYNMAGWGLLIRGDDVAIAFCLWCEWFPPGMSEENKWEWSTGLSDCIVNILLDTRERDASRPDAPVGATSDGEK